MFATFGNQIALGAKGAEENKQISWLLFCLVFFIALFQVTVCVIINT